MNFKYAIFALLIANHAFAQTDTNTTKGGGNSNSSTGNVIATINGNKIYDRQLEEITKLIKDDGGTVTPEIKQRLTTELIIREAVLQDAKKINLGKRNHNALRVKLAEDNAIVGIWFNDYFRNHPITDADIKAEYDRQLALSKELKDPNEYQIAQIALATEIEASDLIAKLNKDKDLSFGKVAQKVSIEKSTAQNGGNAGWALADNFAQPLKEVVPGLSKGQIAPKPLKVGQAYYIVKLLDVRPFKFPALDIAKEQLRAQMMQKAREKAVTDLLKSSGVKVGG